MPKFYEEAAHLLLVIVAQGLLIPHNADHRLIVHNIALILDGLLVERPTHADAALRVLKTLASSGFAGIEIQPHTRLVAIAGTVIGNFMTMHTAPAQK